MRMYTTQLQESKTKQEAQTNSNLSSHKCYKVNAENEVPKTFNPLSYSKGNMQKYPIQRLVDLEAIPNREDKDTMIPKIKAYIERNRIGTIWKIANEATNSEVARYRVLSKDIEAIRGEISKLNRDEKLEISKVLDLLKSVKKRVYKITKEEDRIAILKAAGTYKGKDKSTLNDYVESTLERKLANKVYNVINGIYDGEAVTKIRRQLDERVNGVANINPQLIAHQSITNPKTTNSTGASVGQIGTNIFDYASIKQYAQMPDVNERLKSLIALAEDVTCWVKYGGREIDTRLPSRKQKGDQSENQFGALRSIHQNILEVLPVNTNNVHILGGGSWEIWSHNIQTNDAVHGDNNPNRFLEYTLHGMDRMVYDTKSCIAYFSNHYKFLDVNYTEQSQNYGEGNGIQSPAVI